MAYTTIYLPSVRPGRRYGIFKIGLLTGIMVTWVCPEAHVLVLLAPLCFARFDDFVHSDFAPKALFSAETQ